MNRQIEQVKVCVTRAATVAVLISLAGCGPRAGEVNTGLEQLQRDKGLATISAPDPNKAISKDNQAAWVHQAELNFEEALRAAEAAKANAPAKIDSTPSASVKGVAELDNLEASSGLVSVTRTGTGSTGTASKESSGIDAASTQRPQASQSAASASPNSQLVDLAAKMATLLRQTDASGKPLLTDVAALMPIETMKPGVLASLASTSIDAKHPLFNLNAPDRETLVNARERLLNNPEGVPESLIKSLRMTTIDTSTATAIEITDMALCVRVDGFGRYEPYASTTFVAGRPIRAIVYTQLAKFSIRPARDSDPVQRNVATNDQVSVDLSQELSLYHDPDGLLAWHRPAQMVVETSRTKRSDFYLVQQVELPRSITIGRYNLKVVVTDRTTGAQAERIVPIEVVAENVR